MATALPCPLRQFQFQTGSIKRRQLLSILNWRRGFNSKLVRLKGCSQIPAVNNRKEFQFQTGSIKSSTELTVDVHTGMFQFQTGSIKSLMALAICNCCCSLFQFQTGSIKRFVLALEATPGSPFQFQTGSIKSLRRKSIMRSRKLVSIPNWFD